MELPVEFIQYATEALGQERASVLFSQIDEEAEITSIRVNPFKGRVAVEGLENVAWSNLGYYLPARPLFTLDPIFHAGGYYVQEACSMYMELVRNSVEADYICRNGSGTVGAGFFQKNISALDLCAAPGGKTTHLVSLIGEDSILVSNEVIKSRAIVLADNVAKWGVDNVVVTNNDPADFGPFEEFFDFVVVDAPCSGEGLFRKDPQAIGEWSPANVALCAQRQQRILADIWPALKQGGYLVYSTCTYNKFENDGNVAWLKEQFGAEIVELQLPDNSGIITTTMGGAQFVPGLVKGEGQFVALLYKPAGEDYQQTSKIKSKRGKKGGNGSIQLEKGCNYLPDNYMKVLQGNLVKGYRDSLFEKIRFVEENLKCVLSGVAIAEKKGKDYVPHADLALQCVVARMAAEEKLPAGFSLVEVSKEDALKFLAKEPLLFTDAPMGYLLLSYQGLGLGFVKNLGNRTNNLLPMARRIRMDIK